MVILKQLWEIVNNFKMKDEFDEKDKDIKAFYDLMRSAFTGENETTISSLNKTDAETYDDNDQSENGFMEAPSLNKKRKRENQKEEDKKNECIDPSLPEEAIENVPFKPKELTNIEEATPEDYLMFLLSHLNKSGSYVDLWNYLKNTSTI